MQKINQNRSGENGLPSSVPQGAIRPRGTLFDTLTQKLKTPSYASAVRSSGFHHSRPQRPVNKQPSDKLKSGCKHTLTSSGADTPVLLTVEMLQTHMQNNSLQEVINSVADKKSDSDQGRTQKLPGSSH